MSSYISQSQTPHVVTAEVLPPENGAVAEPEMTLQFTYGGHMQVDPQAIRDQLTPVLEEIKEMYPEQLASIQRIHLTSDVFVICGPPRVTKIDLK